jgi:hypothetical protein
MKKLLLVLLFTAICQAAEELTGTEIDIAAKELTRMEVDITAEQEAFLEAYKEDNYPAMLKLLQKEVKIPTYFENGGKLEIPPAETMNYILRKLTQDKVAKSYPQPTDEDVKTALEITRILAQRKFTGNTRVYCKNGKWLRTPFDAILSHCEYANKPLKNMAAIFIAYGDNKEQAKKEHLDNRMSDIERSSTYSDNKEIQKIFKKTANYINTFFESPELQELIEKERALIYSLAVEADDKIE